MWHCKQGFEAFCESLFALKKENRRTNVGEILAITYTKQQSEVHTNYICMEQAQKMTLVMLICYLIFVLCCSEFKLSSH